MRCITRTYSRVTAASLLLASDGENNENMFPDPDFVLQIIILVTLELELEDIPAIKTAFISFMK